MPPVRIRCVGDSLTDGWVQRFPFEKEPYANRLRSALRDDFSLECECSVHAVGGAVSDAVLGLLDDAIAHDKQPADFYVLLSGTNDMGGGSGRIIDLLDNTLKMIQAALGASPSARVILLTVPPVGNGICGYTLLHSVTRIRAVYNSLLRAIASGVDGDRVIVVDTFSLTSERVPPPAARAVASPDAASDSDDEELEDYLCAIDHLLHKQNRVALNAEKMPSLEALQQVATDALKPESDAWALKEEFDGDGLHLNKAGYECWGAELARVIASLVQKN